MKSQGPDTTGAKPERLKRLRLGGLTPEEALRAAMQVPPPPDEPKKRPNKRKKKAPKSGA